MTAFRVLVRATVAIVLVAVPATTALSRPTSASADGTWSGTLDMGAGRTPGTASGALVQSGHAVTGSLTIDAAPASGVFAVRGKLRGART